MTEFEEITYGMSIHQLEEELKYQYSLGYSDIDAFPSYIINEIYKQKSHNDRLIIYLNELSYIIGQWQNNNFGDVSSTLNLLGIAEEVGELSHHHLKDIQKIRTNEDHRNGKIDSVGDILIFLINYCNKEEINIGEALINTWNKVSKRNWKANPINGNSNEQ